MSRAILRLTTEMLEIRDAKTSDPCAWYALILCVHMPFAQHFVSLLYCHAHAAVCCVLCCCLHARACTLMLDIFVQVIWYTLSSCTSNTPPSSLPTAPSVSLSASHPLTDRRTPHRAPRAVFSPSVGPGSTLASRTMATTSRATTNANVSFDTPLQRDHRSPLRACVHAHLLHACATCFCMRTCLCMHMDRYLPARPPAHARASTNARSGQAHSLTVYADMPTCAIQVPEHVCRTARLLQGHTRSSIFLFLP